MTGRDGIDVDVWVRGTPEARTLPIAGVPASAAGWTDGDVRTLLTQMVMTLERAKNPGSEAPVVALRGFSWIVSAGEGGVLLHLDMHMGTASAGPFAIAEPRLTEMIGRVIAAPKESERVH